MTFKWPALRAVLTAHTVEVNGNRVAGFLVRCTASQKELGYVWPAGSAWRWRTPDGQHYGERSAQRTAVEVLRKAFDLAHSDGIQPRALPFEDDELATEADLKKARDEIRASRTAPHARPAPAPRREPPPPPPPVVKPPQKIVWGPTNSNSLDVTAALAAALRKHRD